MPTDFQMREKRRGERVLIRIPVQLKAVGQDGSEVNEPAETVAVSRFGALLRTSALLKKGSDLSVTNGFSGEAEKFHVVWLGEKPSEGRWDIGIEAANPREDFWGIRFPSAITKG